MSDSDGDGESDMMYHCRKCPGKTFTAAERDIHRAFHLERDQEKRSTSSRRVARKTGRASSPTGTEFTDVTLFHPIAITPPPVEVEKRKPKKPAAKKKKSGAAKRQKISSNKKYDVTVKYTKNGSG